MLCEEVLSLRDGRQLARFSVKNGKWAMGRARASALLLEQDQEAIPEEPPPQKFNGTASSLQRKHRSSL